MIAVMGSVPDHSIVMSDYCTRQLAKSVFSSRFRQNLVAFCTSCTFKPRMWCSPAKQVTQRNWHRLQRLHRRAVQSLLLGLQVYMACYGRSQRATLACQFPQVQLLTA